MAKRWRLSCGQVDALHKSWLSGRLGEGSFNKMAREFASRMNADIDPVALVSPAWRKLYRRERAAARRQVAA